MEESAQTEKSNFPYDTRERKVAYLAPTLVAFEARIGTCGLPMHPPPLLPPYTLSCWESL